MRKLLATACKLYAMDHQEAYPPNLDELFPELPVGSDGSVSSLSPNESMAYYYYGGTEKDAPDKVLLMSKFKDRRGKRIIVHVDMSGLIGIPPPNLLPPSGQ